MIDKKIPTKYKEIEKVKIYVENNYMEDMDLRKIGKMFYFNYSALSRSFKHYTGSSFVKYVNNKRIEKAKEILLLSDYKIQEISKMIGFNSLSYFERAFKKSTNMTPGEYRETFKKDDIKELEI